jgi:hypothetical protein
VIIMAPDGATSALDRANATAKQLNDLLDQDLRAREVYLAPSGTVVIARTSPVISVSDADAKLAKSTPQAVATAARKRIFDVLWGEYLKLNT